MPASEPGNLPKQFGETPVTVVYTPRDELADEWSTRELADKIDAGRVEDLALAIRVLAARMAAAATAEEQTGHVSRNEICYLGDLGWAVDSITAAAAWSLRSNADTDEDHTHVELTLAALRAASDGLLEVADGWI